VLRPGGRAVVLDKFVRGRPGLARRLANLVARPLFSDLTRRLEPLMEDTGLRIAHREPAAFGGLFEIVLLEKPAAAGPDVSGTTDA
jgi:hypothetical protein